MQRLHAVTKDLRAVAELDALLPKVLEGALSLTGADFGTVQIFDPATGSLKIVTQAGSGPEFLEYFAVVDDDASACGRAAQEGAQVVIVDVNADAGFARHREIAASAGFRAVQSTPLVDYAGRLIGMVSTHFRRPHRPSDRDLGSWNFTATSPERRCASAWADSARPDAGAPVGQAVVSALLDHDDGPNGNVSVPFEAMAHGPDDGKPRPPDPAGIAPDNVAHRCRGRGWPSPGRRVRRSAQVAAAVAGGAAVSPRERRVAWRMPWLRMWAVSSSASWRAARRNARMAACSPVVQSARSPLNLAPRMHQVWPGTSRHTPCIVADGTWRRALPELVMSSTCPAKAGSTCATG